MGRAFCFGARPQLKKLNRFTKRVAKSKTITYMRTLGNIIWHIPFLGFVSAFFVFLGGCFWSLTIVGLPIGLGLFQYSRFLLSPFGHAMVSNADLGKKRSAVWATWSTIIRILYFPFGLIGAIALCFQVAAMFVSIVGIPVALVLAKSLGTVFNPINKSCVSSAVLEELERRQAAESVKKHLG